MVLKVKLTLVIQQHSDSNPQVVTAWNTDGSSVIRWPGGTEVVLSSGSEDRDIITFFWDGVDTWYATYAVNFDEDS